MLNKLKGILQVCAVKAPGYGDRRKAMLEDIAILTGGKADLQGPRHPARETMPRLQPTCGRAKKVKIDAENTTITEGAGDKKAIEGRAEMIRTRDRQDRQRVRPREAAGAAGEAGRRRRPVKVGAATETEMKERKALYEDALHATRAAIAEGIVPGGGVALLQARKVLDKSEARGRRGARRARCCYDVLEMPCRLIAENAGLDGTVVVTQHPQEQGQELRLQRRHRRVRATSARPASSTR